MDLTALHPLTGLDPAPAPLRSDTADRRRDAMLERVLAAPQQASAPARPLARLGRRVVVIAAAGALAVPVAVGGAHLIAHRLDPAAHGLDAGDLAGWVATAVPRTAAQLSDRAKQWCIDATDRQAGTGASVSIAGGDERGRVASMLITRDGYTDVCLANAAGGGGYWELVSAPDSPLPAVGAREVLLQSEGSHGSNGIGTAWGQAGADVREVVLHFRDRDVTAVVTDGVWNTWWPAGRVVDDLPATATITDSRGRAATVPVRTP